MNFEDLQEINFVDTDILPIYGAAKKLVEEELGRTLARGDPLNLYLKTLLSVIIQQRELINTLAKENLLAYASGENLEYWSVAKGYLRRKRLARLKLNYLHRACRSRRLRKVQELTQAMT